LSRRSLPLTSNDLEVKLKVIQSIISRSSLTLNDLEVESTVVPELSEVEIQSEVLQHDDT